MISASDGIRGSRTSFPPVGAVVSIVDDEEVAEVVVDADFACLRSGCIFAESFFPSSTRSSGQPGRSDCTIRRDTNGTSFAGCSRIFFSFFYNAENRKEGMKISGKKDVERTL